MSSLNNDLGYIEMEQEFGDEGKKLQNIDEKHWPKYFGDFKNVMKYFSDIAKAAKRSMVLCKMTDEIMTVTT